MRCRVCGAKLKDEWNYCPYCGSAINPRTFDEIFELFEKSFREIFGEGLAQFPFGKGFLIEISKSEGREPKVSIRELNGRENKEVIKPKNSRVVEPKLESYDGGKFLKIYLPGVEEKDIDIRKLSKSVEIRAKAKDKLYFTIIPNPNLTYKKFENGILILKFS